MSNTIQHYSFNDTSSYGKNIKLNINIDELNSKQNEDRKGSFAVVDRNDVATVEISEIARTMYGAVSNVSKKQERVSGAEREQKELEEWIATHPADRSIDLMRNGNLVQQINGNAVNLVDEALIAAENEYTKAFVGVAEDFADFSMKITYGNYSSNDVSVNDLNFGTIDKMEELYQSYKKQIQSNYEGDERTKYLNKLDEVYNAVFAEKIINPVKSAYDDKIIFFEPDSEETVKSIRAASASKETLNEMVSNYVANQAVNKKQYTALSDGTKSFYDMVNDTSLWHDTAKVRSILTDSMNVYSSVKEVKADSSVYLSAKSAADEIAKEISDKYAENLEYKAEMIGLKKDGEDTEWSKILNAALTNTSSGMFMIDFSKIMDLSSVMG